MADNGSRNSLFLAFVPSLLLVWAMAFMVAVYGWRLDPKENPALAQAAAQAAPAPPAAGTMPVPTVKSPAPPLALAQQADNASPSRTMCGPGGELPLNEDANVDILNCWRPIRLSYGNVRISVMQRPYREGQVSESVVTFRRPGLPRQRIVISAAEIGGLTFRVGHRRAVVLSCPAYVATAARVGQFRGAWRDVLSVYEPGRDDDTIYEHFPHHLRRFLRVNGYLSA